MYVWWKSYIKLLMLHWYFISIQLVFQFNSIDIWIQFNSRDLNCYLYHHSPQADHQVMIFPEGMIILDHILPDESPAIYLVFSSYDLLELFAGEKWKHFLTMRPTKNALSVVREWHRFSIAWHEAEMSPVLLCEAVAVEEFAKKVSPEFWGWAALVDWCVKTNKQWAAPSRPPLPRTP